MEFLIRKVQLLKSSRAVIRLVTDERVLFTCVVTVPRDLSLNCRLHCIISNEDPSRQQSDERSSLSNHCSKIRSTATYYYYAIISTGDTARAKMRATPLVAGLYTEFLTRSVVDPGGARMKIEANTANTVNVAAP